MRKILIPPASSHRKRIAVQRFFHPARITADNLQNSADEVSRDCDPAVKKAKTTWVKKRIVGQKQ